MHYSDEKNKPAIAITLSFLIGIIAMCYTLKHPESVDTHRKHCSKLPSHHTLCYQPNDISKL